MANDCSNKLTVVGLQCVSEEFTKALELTMYGEEVDEGDGAASGWLCFDNEEETWNQSR